MYRAILQKTLCCDVNGDLLHPVNGSLFYCGGSPLCCIWRTFFFIVQRCSNISRKESLVETMLNLQLYKKIYIYFMMVYWLLSCLYVLCVVALLTVWSVRGECICFFLYRVYFMLFMQNIQDVPGGKELTSGECSLGQTIPI